MHMIVKAKTYVSTMNPKFTTAKTFTAFSESKAMKQVLDLSIFNNKKNKSNLSLKSNGVLGFWGFGALGLGFRV